MCNFFMCDTHLIASNFLEGSLEVFEVVDVLVFQVSPKLDFLKLNGARKEKVHKLAVSGS